MRLTLRTMLAYMDGILEPDDAQDIGRKIEESEYATKLLHRTRDVVRRLRLAAPSLTDRGPGLDPNTVAEYLDNTLSDDRVPDFEKVCLESDVHLAEVASCHQILTLVLGEPVEIDPGARQRMYQVPQALAAQSVAESPPAAVVQPAIAAVKSDDEGHVFRVRERPTVPDYLRDPRRRRQYLPVAAALLLVVCFAALVLMALGQFESGTLLGNLLGIQPAEREVARGQGGEDEGTKTPAVDAESSGKSIEITQPFEGDLTGKVVAVPEEPAPLPGDVEVAPGAVRLPSGKAPAPPGVIGPAEPRNPPGESATKPGPVEGVLEPGPQMPVEPGAKTPEERGAEPKRETPQAIGRLMSDRQPLLLFDAKSVGWQRVLPKGSLIAQDRLVAIPTFRPEITIGNGLTVQLLGGTRVELLGAEKQQPAGLKVAYGRIVCMPLAQAPARLRLTLGSQTGMVTFSQAESVAALEVTLARTPGANPETEPAQIAADLYATAGELLWDEAERPTVRLAAPSQLMLGQPPQAPTAVKDLPRWVSSEPLGLLDGQASATIEQALLLDRPPVLPLLELSEHRKRELRWLAARSLTYVDRFDPMVAVLNDPQMKLDWPDYIAELREAVARSPETAAALRAALEKQYGQSGPDLYRMLWGYTEKDLRAGEDAKLVKFLDHETLAARVLSFWNLKEITGAGHHYQPELPAAKRLQAVRTWKKRQESGEITLKSAGEPGKKPPAPADVPPVPSEKEL